MSIIAYPLEATEYTAEDVQSYLSTRTSGVYSEDITFTPEGMTVTVSPFLAWFNYAKFKGCSVAVTEPETLTFSPAHAVLDRIDRIALRVDFTLNKAYFTVIEGVASSSPVPPDISKTEVVNDISPVYVKIKAGSTEITPADITSTILDESVCGIMRDGVTGIPTAQLQAQVEQLIVRLHEAISEVQSNSAFMIGEVYDPSKKAKEVAFKDETPVYSETITDCNNALSTGWYACSEGCLNTPNEDVFDNLPFDLLYVVRTSISIYQTINYKGISAKRRGTSSDNGETWIFDEWEWIEPPMVLGTPYRTTKRYAGKVVYAILQDLGSLPASGTKNVMLNCGDDNKPANYLSFNPIIKGSSRTYTSGVLTDNNGSAICRIGIEGTKTVEIRVYTDMSGYTAKIYAEYTLG